MAMFIKNDFRMLYIAQFVWVTIAVLLFVGNAMAVVDTCLGLFVAMGSW